ncbi:MAG TPA: U32 family peptidase [Candidatus Methanoperedenaceae archaeon]|nr:U32 family peptidase [Candidatus Methanoperedenaceae archaeon]
MTMKLLAPAESMETARNVIEAGAEEIYLGLETPSLVNINLSGRGRGCNVKSEEELAEIVGFAHERDVDVFYTVNTPFLGDGLEEMYTGHVRKGIDAGVDALIVGEFGALSLVRERFPDIPVHASVLLNTLNRGQVEMLRELGASRVVLEFKVALDEVRELSGIIGLEVFGQFGCSNINGTCHLIHNAGESINFGLPCRGNYRVSADDRLHNILDAGTDCSICSIPALMEAGVVSLKIVGRCMNPMMIRQVVSIYRESIDLARSGAGPAELRANVLEKIPFWQMLCEQRRCKYMSSPILDSYI